MSWTARHQQQRRGAFICGQMARGTAICGSRASCAPLSSTLIACTHANGHRSSAGSPFNPCAEQTPKHPMRTGETGPPKMDSAGNGAQTGHGSAAERPRMAMRHAFLGAQHGSVGLAAPQGQTLPPQVPQRAPPFACPK